MPALEMIFRDRLFVLLGGELMDDSFTLYDLKVEVVASEKPMVCSHKEGDYFLVEGENLVFPQTHSFSMYALAALLPILPAKQRPLQTCDWMLSDSLIACPDPNCGAKFRITRTGKRILKHGDCTVVPVWKEEENHDR
jgi:uncharacterized repeat protein (TIGR04076 family)